MELQSSCTCLQTHLSCAPTVLSNWIVKSLKIAAQYYFSIALKLLLTDSRSLPPQASLKTPSKGRQWDIVNILSLSKDKSWSHAVIIIKAFSFWFLMLFFIFQKNSF